MASDHKWSSGLYDCGDSSATCCLTCCLPCVTFGRVAHLVDDGQSSCCAQGFLYGLLMTIQAQWVYSCIYRRKLRAKFGLAAEPCGDCCLHLCCEPCALCQEHAELKSRGFNPLEGWGAQSTAPPVPPSMQK